MVGYTQYLYNIAHINNCYKRSEYLESDRQNEILSDSGIAGGITWTSIFFLETDCTKLK